MQARFVDVFKPSPPVRTVPSNHHHFHIPALTDRPTDQPTDRHPAPSISCSIFHFPSNASKQSLPEKRPTERRNQQQKSGTPLAPNRYLDRSGNDASLI
ncbi:hypothetical protein LZ30DRAFT_117951 [Colletotrichum cereale]|nr:hypothetical protein LZ30DRAFT_117951 [Colletotrichum cereale]